MKIYMEQENNIYVVHYTMPDSPNMVMSQHVVANTEEDAILSTLDILSHQDIRLNPQEVKILAVHYKQSFMTQTIGNKKYFI